MANLIIFNLETTVTEKLYFGFILSLIVLIYFLVIQFLQWIIKRQYWYVLRYCLASLFFLNAFFLILLIVNNGQISREFIAAIIQFAFLFGLLLTFYLSVAYLYIKIFKKKA